MRIAQVAPLYESVPPKAYGGTERVVSYLTEELVRRGHDVTLFASGDSITSARLIAPCERSLRLDDGCVDRLAHHVLMIELVVREMTSFDMVHFHIDYLHFPICRRAHTPHVTTVHSRLDLPDITALYGEFGDMPLVSISEAQRQPLSWAGWIGTVYHGLPEDLYTFRERPGDYLAFVGRISPEKRVDRAIEIAERVGMPIRIAAKVDAADREYYEGRIRRLLELPHVEYVGEVGEREKDELLGNAYALLFPIDWPEPFGLVMIESMACGTPVIAYRQASVPEIVTDGVTGFTFDTMEGAVEAVAKIAALDRRRCRQMFEERFSVGRMTDGYLDIYERLLAD